MTQSIALLDLDKNPNIGLFLVANEKFCLCGYNVTEKKRKSIEKILGVPCYEVRVLGTDLCGVFLACNNDILLSPELFPHEEKVLQEICKKHEVELVCLDLRVNAIGNNLCLGDKEVLVGAETDKVALAYFKKKKYKVHTLKNKEFEAAGSVVSFIKGKYIVSQELEEKDLKGILSKIAVVTSVNRGSPFVASGIVGTSKGLLLGSLSTTIEIQNIAEGLEYL
ncbi:hypothetical protein KC842_03160 [Candidatus Nomurabacteria bacterium]|nr:hypothetical protein [Candidatus Nomurabacteria bacterium]USN44266.1 MAG: hypothetical protein H6500_00255 [Candidatus Woesearchaeota archaeon]